MVRQIKTLREIDRKNRLRSSPLFQPMPTISTSCFGYTGSSIADGPKDGPVPFRPAVDAGGSKGAAQKMVPPRLVARKNTPNGTRRVSL